MADGDVKLTPEMLAARQRPHMQRMIKQVLVELALHRAQRLAQEAESNAGALRAQNEAEGGPMA